MPDKWEYPWFAAWDLAFHCVALAQSHRDHPFALEMQGRLVGMVDYEPGESTTGLFGGNSNWRGPVWFPVNYLVIEALRRFARYCGDDFTVEHPSGSGRQATLTEIADDLSARLVSLFLDDDGRRPVYGDAAKFQTDPAWHRLIPFHEYFHGDSGAGLGASHQTGWTGLVADLIARRTPKRVSTRPVSMTSSSSAPVPPARSSRTS